MRHTLISPRCFTFATLTFFLLMVVVPSRAQVSIEFHNTPLTEALRAIEEGQEEYSISILSDGLSHLHTSVRVKNMSVPDAVSRICKNQPVKVKTRGNLIGVQLKKGVTISAEGNQLTVSGDIEDAFLLMPLPRAKVSILDADSSVLVDSAAMAMFYDGNQRPLMAKYSATITTNSKTLLIHAQLRGYDDVWRSVSIGKQKEIEVPKMQMRKMRSVELSEVVITATRVKMFYRGDTLVYDATAFDLPQGSMLDDLIRQMPGVTMNSQGEIFVNGRKVDELLLGSRSFMRGNKRVLLENLPYYTVKDIKVYERQSDKSVALGYDVDPRQYVMDVNLKEEYQRGYIANVEAAIGTHERWLTRAFILGFTDRWRLTLLGNANNVNEGRHAGASDNWTPASMPQSMFTTRSVATDIDYVSKGNKVKNNLTASYTSTTDRSETRSRYEQFLPGHTPLSLSETFNRSGNHRWSAHDNLTLQKPFYAHIEFDFNYSKRDNRFSSLFDQWDDSLTASRHTRAFSEGKAWGGYVEAQGAFNVGAKQQHINYYIKAEHNEDESESAQRFSTAQYVNPSRNIQHNTDEMRTVTTWGVASLNYGMKIFKDVNMSVGERLYVNHNKAHDYLYHPDTLMLASSLDALGAITDINKSYDSRLNVVENELGVLFSTRGLYTYQPGLPYKVNYQRLSVGLSLPMNHASYDYQRGTLDTLARQNSLFLNTSASFRNVSEDGKHDFKISASLNRKPVYLPDRITYRDDSQPLVVKLGNPDLKSTVTSSFGIDFSNKGGEHQQQWHVGTSANIYHRQTAQSVSYDTETGVYTYQPMNVKGAYRLGAKFDFSRAIDHDEHWTWQTGADAGFNHSIDHSMFAGENASHENIVNTLTLHDGAYLQYNKDKLNIRATGDIRWRHSEGRMYDFATLNATDFQYGLSARYTTPPLWGRHGGGLTLSANATMYSRRGYGSSELNTDDFVLNASISQPFFKGKLIARIEAFDLLHQLSSTSYDINAQGRTVTWHRSLPHYVMLHMVYHWNKNPKK